MGAAWPQGNLPFLKLAEKSCFLTCPTEWKWRKTARSLGVEVALLFLWPNSCGCWQNKPRAQNNQLQFTPGDIYFPCSLGSLPKEGTSSFAMSHVWRQSNTGDQARGAEQEELNDLNERVQCAHTSQGGWGTMGRQSGVQLAGSQYQHGTDDPGWMAEHWRQINMKAVRVVESKS